MIWTGPALPLLALVWPLALAALGALPTLRDRVVLLLPFMPLPALWLALAGAPGETQAPWLLMGVTLGLDAARQLLVGMTAALWLVAGMAAAPMAGQPRAAIFAGFWGLTFAGNLGVFLAQDVVTFYVAFAAVSLAGWFLVVQERTAAALRAGRVYIVLALAGEVCLLMGLMIGAQAAGDLAVAPVRAALADAPAAVALLVTGFGIKAGLVPLHVWLPLAHPAAPVPASAVLSGAIVKAGLIGWLTFLPAAATAGDALVALGLVGAFGAALWGLTQRNPKAVLAYSTISQMGLMAVLVGAGGAAREAAVFFALHHGLAKGALFLLAGCVMAASGRLRIAGLVVAGLVALSVAGAPLTGGALAKTVAKPALPETLATALSLSSITTTLVLAWFLRCLLVKQSTAAPGTARALAIGAIPAVLAFVVPVAVWPDWSAKALRTVAAPDALVSAAWPVALGLALAAVVILRPLAARAPGDLLALAALPGRRVPRGIRHGNGESLTLSRALPSGTIRWLEARLARRSVAMLALPVLVLVLAVLLAG
jgi:formate hydrogenlyase subunit 3/multisubunit Na+/H+ antiporter MnhD subunit